MSAMRHSRRSAVLLAVLAAGLSSCASPSGTDWNAMQDEADRIVETWTAEEGSLGAATLLSGAQDSPSEDDGGIILSFPSAMRVDSIVATCFGDGTARFGYSTDSAESTSISDSVDILCDGAETEIPLAVHADAVHFRAVLVSGKGAVVAAAVSGADV